MLEFSGSFRRERIENVTAFPACRGRRGVSQFTVIKQFLVDFDLFGNAQAIRHLHDVNTVEEGFVVFVITESDPFGFVRVGENNPVERQGGDTFRPVVVTFPVAVNKGCSTFIGALNISTNSMIP